VRLAVVDHGHAPAMLTEVFKDCSQRRLCLQQVLTRFYNQQIDAAIAAVALAERLSAEDLAQLRELAHRTG